jgi:hypothetical protein
MAASPAPDLCARWSAGAAYERLATLAERLSRTVAVARGLITANRSVDLAGFEDGVGVLCAKALDLEREESRRLLPALLELRAQIDGLAAAITNQRPHPAPGPVSAARRGTLQRGAH